MYLTIYGTLLVLGGVFTDKGLADKNIQVHSGDVISPRMDIQRKKYQKNEDQSWYMNAESGHWALVFHYLSIEIEQNCRHDYIEIREQPGSSGIRRPPTRYCGEILPKPYISDASRLSVRFVSDDIWEGNGFNMTVMYSDQKDLLESKIHQITQKHAAAIAYQAEKPDGTEHEFGRGALFYILIGSSSAALVLFVILLTYFGYAMRRQVYTHETRVPKLHYISGSTVNAATIKNDGTFVRLKSGTNVQTVQELCMSGKKRYSKDKKTPTAAVCDSTAQKYVVRDNRIQHNNVYVDNRK